MQHELAGMVIELIRVQAADHEPVIGMLAPCAAADR
jgi:hypothetical protein